jgi:hydrogenase nickel incorporation protein HypB
MKTIHTSQGKTIEVNLETNLLKKNDVMALENLDLLNKHHIHAVDVLGSIGSGKTTLIQQMVSALSSSYRIAAIAGDLTTSIDADRIREKGAEVLQINTDGGCHLDANLVRMATDILDLDNLDLILIENVGNLICPGEFPVGAHQRMVVVSTTEGPYMIVKHPYILREASTLAINKIDLAGSMDVDPEQLRADALKIKPDLHVVLTNGRTGEGIEKLIQALKLTKSDA